MQGVVYSCHFGGYGYSRCGALHGANEVCKRGEVNIVGEEFTLIEILKGPGVGNDLSTQHLA